MIYIASFIFSLIAIMVMLIYLAPARVVTFALNATRKKSSLVRKEITLPNGLHYVYLEGGQGEPLMLLHGFGGNKDTFTYVSKYLVKRYRVIIPDIIGFGESSHPQQADYSPTAQAEQLRLLSQALHLEKLHLAGNSMGGQIALLYAALYPSEVNSLWLLSPAGIWSVQNNLLNTISQTGHNPLVANNLDEYRNVMALGMRKPPFIPQPMLKVLAQERFDNVALETVIFEQIMAQSIEQQIKGMPVPTLIVFGEQDRVIPVETANVLSELLPHSKVILMPNIGHVAMFEKPAQCAKDYILFRDII